MYAIFMTGGKQYKVEAGDILRIEKINGDVGDEVKFENVIAFSGADNILKTGTPYLDATVNATITGIGRGEKVIIFKFKAKKDYRKKQGHRQPYTEIEVDNFTIDGKSVGVKPEKPKVEDKIEAAKEEAEEPQKEKPAKAKAEKKAKAKPEIKAIEAEIEALEAEVESAEASAAEPPAEEPKKEKPAKAKAEKKAKATPEIKAIEAGIEALEAEVESAEASVTKPKKVKTAKVEEVSVSKLTKAEIAAKLDDLGVEYNKSAKKDELIALLEAAGSK